MCPRWPGRPRWRRCCGARRRGRGRRSGRPGAGWSSHDDDPRGAADEAGDRGAGEVVTDRPVELEEVERGHPALVGVVGDHPHLDRPGIGVAVVDRDEAAAAHGNELLH